MNHPLQGSILLVDDEASIVRSLHRALRAPLGNQVKIVTCHSGAEAIEALLALYPSVEHRHVVPISRVGHFGFFRPEDQSKRKPGTTENYGHVSALGGAPVDWQLVGYVERQEIAEDGDDESAPWREYLLRTTRGAYRWLESLIRYGLAGIYPA